jgi:hypothetical protein
MPPEFLRAIPAPNGWDHLQLLEWAKKLMVNAEALVHALNDAGLLSGPDVQRLKRARVPREDKPDPELSVGLAPRIRERKVALLQKGLSDDYVSLCFDAYERDVITAGRLTEMLLCDESDLHIMADLYGRRLIHVD